MSTEPSPGWLQLPVDQRCESLWIPLHDGELVGIASDFDAGRITLSFEVEYVRQFHDLPEDFRFLVQLDGVQSAKILRYGEESIPWADYESSFANAKTSLEVAEAEFACAPEGTITLSVVGNHDHGREYRQIYSVAGQITFLRSDGEHLGLDAFRAFGEQYWAAWSDGKVESSIHLRPGVD